MSVLAQDVLKHRIIERMDKFGLSKADMAKRLNKLILNSKLVIVKSAGHFSYIDRYDEFVWQVREFI